LPPEPTTDFAAIFLCATPRSGTTLLCDLLTDSGVAGNPDSYYRRQSIPNYCKRFGIDFGEGETFEQLYVEAVRKHATRCGIFGFRVMWQTMPELAAVLSRLYPDRPDEPARLEAAFGRPLYVYLTRQDKIAQAISRLKAEQTGLWHRATDGSERERTFAAQPAVYDPARLTAFVAENEADESSWESWFARHDIAPLRLTYEALAADPQDTLAQILIALGKDPAIANSIQPRTSKLSDAESRDWAARFRDAE
jgi:LPS sulfotransferase NodH